MRRLIIILGILLTTAILLNGSALAQTWHYAVDVTDSDNCWHPEYALYAPNSQHAALATQVSPIELGWVILDLGSNNEMDPDQDFTVFADSSVLEYYRVYISDGDTTWYPEDGWLGEDTQDKDFTTPSTPVKEWRYIKIVGISAYSDPGDPMYGADIDAVGWYG